MLRFVFLAHFSASVAFVLLHLVLNHWHRFDIKCHNYHIVCFQLLYVTIVAFAYLLCPSHFPNHQYCLSVTFNVPFALQSHSSRVNLIEEATAMHPRYSPAPPLHHQQQPQQQQPMGGPHHQQQQQQVIGGGNGHGGGAPVHMRAPPNSQQLPPQMPRSQNYANVSA